MLLPNFKKEGKEVSKRWRRKVIDLQNNEEAPI